jgi:hypothetical protein
MHIRVLQAMKGHAEARRRGEEKRKDFRAKAQRRKEVMPRRRLSPVTSLSEQAKTG